MKFEPSLHKLSNGLTVMLDPMDAASTKVVVAFDTGSRDEKPNEYGITHFCEHMLCKGTKRFKDYNEINDFISDNSGIWNAATSDNYLKLYGRIYSNNASVLLDVFSDMLQNSTFDENVIENEKTVILDELRRKQDNLNSKVYEFINNKIFGENYPTYRTLGTEANIKSFNRKQLKMFIGRRLSAKNCVICVSGKIDDKDALLKDIESKYSFLKSFDVSKNIEDVPYVPDVAHYSIKEDKNTNFSIVFPGLYKYKEENLFKRMCVRTFEDWMRYNLYNVLRQENGLVYGVQSVLYGPKEQRLNGFSTTATPENLEKVVSLMARTVNDVYMKNHITNDYINRYNNRMKLGDADFLESNERRASKLISYYLDFGTLYDFNSVIKMSNDITAADVIRNSRGYFDGPISIISNGADYDMDLIKVWNENIGNLSQQNSMIITKDDKCR